MSIPIQCRNCNQALQVTIKQAGKQVRCPSCEAMVRIPYEADLEEIERAAIKAASESTEKIKLRCPGCKKILQFGASTAGKAVKCPGCEKVFKVPMVKK